jgi:para-aminobenzoate synthetase/4-amino-4-deoxychorismate lyase
MTAAPVPAAGVFETLLVRDGRPVELDAHLARLAASLGLLFGMPLPDLAAPLVRRAASRVTLGRLRLNASPAGVSARVAEVAPELVFPVLERAPWLRPLPVRGGIGAHKWADRRLLEAAERRAGPGALPLVVDVDGSVLEASRANVFVISGGVLVTPPADGRLLPGITRRRVLELAARSGLDVREQAVSYDALLAADEVFLTGAVRGIEPARGCDGETEWREAPVASLLAQRLERLWDGISAKEATR